EPTELPEGIQMRRLEAPNARSKMDLTLFFRKTPTNLNLSAEFSTDIFDTERIARLLAQFETLLTASTAHPDTPIGALQVLPPAEQELVLHAFNDTCVDYDLSTPVHHLFERQVNQTPDRVATVDERGHLTYAELNAKANTLAWMLR